MKYLALDYGQVRTGIAVSDAGGVLAFPRCTIIKRKRVQFFEELLGILEKEQPDAIVIGLPKDLYGNETLTTRQVRNFAASLSRRISLPLYWMSEELSSIQAQRDLHEAGRSCKSGKTVLDQQAAVIILQSFLDSPEKSRQRILSGKSQ